MKRGKIKFTLIAFILITIAVFANTNPVVTNVNYSYSDGNVLITFDVSDAEEATVTIMMYVSSNSGTTWDYSCVQIAGDVGTNIAVGINKHIIWYHDAEHGSPPSGTTFLIKIVANDEQSGGNPCAGFEKVYYEGGPNSDANGVYYNTIQIGSQCWFKENLNVGSEISSGVEQTDNSVIEKYCYANYTVNCNTYGGLYQWAEAVQYQNGATNTTFPNPSFSGNIQGICPSGWHVPTEAELHILYNAVGGNGGALKELGVGVYPGTNTSGFSSLIAGCISSSGGSLWKDDYYVFYWTTSETGIASDAYMHRYYSYNDNINIQNWYKNWSLSVRCVKD
ncbi:MAG: hypothetical protein GXO87_08920 [Chlorobi bacterium]|nr:hypothetical protein [Chlorobiota bacterium]